MSQDSSTYDLGDLDLGASAPEPVLSRPTLQDRKVRPRGVTHRPAPARAPRPVGPDPSGSLSVFIPGATQIVRGDTAVGLFFLASLGLVVTLGWAVLSTMDRLAGTLTLVGYSPAIAVWALCGLLGIAAILHLACVLNAGSDSAWLPNPIVTGVASLVIPGWGQLLNGDRRRAVLFIGALWLVGAAWLLVSPPVERIIDELGLYLPAWASILASPGVRWTLPAIVWTLAVYDAASRANRLR